MIRLTTREGRTVIAVAVTPTLVDKEILRHKGKSYVFVGKLKGDWIWHEATIGDIGAPQAQCCMCGKKGLSTAEDGGPECELSDGRWTCSSACWEMTADLSKDPAVLE